MSRIRSIRQITHNGHLNYYQLDAENRKGGQFPYYVASRALTADDLVMNRPGKLPDGVVIYSLCGPQLDKVVLVRQFRYPVGDYVYEFPAGLVEEGEDFRASAVREMKEETGMEFRPMHVDPMFERAFFTTDGMTDERCSMVYGTASGQPDLNGLEDTEDLSVVIAGRQEAKRILAEENCAMMCAYMLMHFIKDEKPFGFLEI